MKYYALPAQPGNGSEFFRAQKVTGARVPNDPKPPAKKKSSGLRRGQRKPGFKVSPESIVKRAEAIRKNNGEDCPLPRHHWITIARHPKVREKCTACQMTRTIQPEPEEEELIYTGPVTDIPRIEPKPSEPLAPPPAPLPVFRVPIRATRNPGEYSGLRGW